MDQAVIPQPGHGRGDVALGEAGAVSDLADRAVRVAQQVLEYRFLARDQGQVAGLAADCAREREEVPAEAVQFTGVHPHRLHR